MANRSSKALSAPWARSSSYSVSWTKTRKSVSSLKGVDHDIIYKLCLDTWLSVERYGEAAVRVASECIYDIRSQNFALNNDDVSLQQNSVEV